MKKLILIVAAMFAITAGADYVQTLQPNRGGSGRISPTAHFVLLGEGAGAFGMIDPSTAGFVLTSNGAADPTFQAVPSGANTTLSNLGVVALNASLLPATSGSANLGSALLPFGTDFANFLELMGSGSGDIVFSAGATPTPHTLVFPSTVCAAGQSFVDNGSGVLSCGTPTPIACSVVNGGDAAYAILAGDCHVRDTTTLTANRAYTLDACTAGNIGEKHSIKNLFTQTFNIILTPAGTDTIDSKASMILMPGDDESVICAASGYWDEL